MAVPPEARKESNHRPRSLGGESDARAASRVDGYAVPPLKRQSGNAHKPESGVSPRGSSTPAHRPAYHEQAAGSDPTADHADGHASPRPAQPYDKGGGDGDEDKHCRDET